MGICMMCHKTIPNGKKFCDNCENKRRMQADESYLDSLLNSVSNDSANPVLNNPYLKKNKENSHSNASTAQDSDNTTVYNEAQTYADQAPEYTEVESLNSNDVEVDDMLDGLLADMDAAGFGQEEEPAEQLKEDDLDDIFNSIDNGNMMSDALPEEEVAPAIEDDGLFEIDEALEKQSEDFLNNQNYATVSEEDFISSENGSNQSDVVDEADTRTAEEIELDDMFSNPPSDENDVNNMSVTNINWDTMGEAADLSVDPSVADLFEEVGPDSGNVIDINDSSDLDALLSGGDTSELDKLMDEIESGGELDLGDPSKPVKPEKVKKSGGIIGWFKKLFGNVDLTPEEIAAKEREAQEEEQKKKDKAEAAKLNAESKKEMEALEKAKAKEQAEIKKKAAEAAKAKKEAAAKEKAEKAKKKKEAALAVAEYEIDKSRINKAGATILFVIFAILTIFIIIGTNIYSYKLSIENAQKEFEVQHYNEAYYEVYGLKIQDEDIELYDRIMTVMYVNTQLNSYEHYMKANERERALNSLIKGLQRYEKYYQLATILEISDDLNFVKKEILSNLDTEFNMSEEDAYALVDVDNSLDYSTYIYGLLGTYDDQLKELKDINSIEDLKAFNASLMQGNE